MTNDPANRVVTLTCRAKVLQPVVVQPHILNFNEVSPYMSPGPRTVILRRGDGGPIKPRIVSPERPGIQAELREVKEGEQYELTILLEPPQKPGKLRTWIMLETGVKEVPQRSVPIYADIPQQWSPAYFGE